MDDREPQLNRKPRRILDARRPVRRRLWLPHRQYFVARPFQCHGHRDRLPGPLDGWICICLLCLAGLDVPWIMGGGRRA